LDLHNLEEALRRVQTHYGSAEPVRLGNVRRRTALDGAVEIFQALGNLQHLTTETLADVYEQALVTETMREQHGTHATPPYLVDYILWQLAPWIEEIDPKQLRVFEPACGHAPFLVGMVRLLRTFGLGMAPEELSRFFRRCFTGIDQDAFAVEIGRLSLTVADVPHSNGWNGLRAGNMFARGVLERAATQSRVFLANPPFEGGTPLRLLERTLPHLPPGSVFGVIVPSTLLFTDKRRPTEFRRRLQEECQLMEVSLFPDQLFRFADHECSVLLGRKHPSSLLKKGIRPANTCGFSWDFAGSVASE
jgi:type I restriction-modification system DNA methylase subunit